MKKRFLSSLLALSMLLSLLPVTAVATNVEFPCAVTEDCILENGHEGDCVLLENPPTAEESTVEPIPCTATEGCTLEDGHEGDCVLTVGSEPPETSEAANTTEPRGSEDTIELSYTDFRIDQKQIQLSIDYTPGTENAVTRTIRVDLPAYFSITQLPSNLEGYSFSKDSGVIKEPGSLVDGARYESLLITVNAAVVNKLSVVLTIQQDTTGLGKAMLDAKEQGDELPLNTYAKVWKANEYASGTPLAQAELQNTSSIKNGATPTIVSNGGMSMFPSYAEVSWAESMDNPELKLLGFPGFKLDGYHYPMWDVAFLVPIYPDESGIMYTKGGAAPETVTLEDNVTYQVCSLNADQQKELGRIYSQSYGSSSGPSAFEILFNPTRYLPDVVPGDKFTLSGSDIYLQYKTCEGTTTQFWKSFTNEASRTYTVPTYHSFFEQYQRPNASFDMTSGAMGTVSIQQRNAGWISGYGYYYPSDTKSRAERTYTVPAGVDVCEYRITSDEHNITKAWYMVSDGTTEQKVEINTIPDNGKLTFTHEEGKRVTSFTIFYDLMPLGYAEGGELDFVIYDDTPKSAYNFPASITYYRTEKGVTEENQRTDSTATGIELKGKEVDLLKITQKRNTGNIYSVDGINSISPLYAYDNQHYEWSTGYQDGHVLSGVTFTTNATYWLPTPSMEYPNAVLTLGEDTDEAGKVMSQLAGVVLKSELYEKASDLALLYTTNSHPEERRWTQAEKMTVEGTSAYQLVPTLETGEYITGIKVSFGTLGAFDYYYRSSTNLSPLFYTDSVRQTGVTLDYDDEVNLGKLTFSFRYGNDQTAKLIGNAAFPIDVTMKGYREYSVLAFPDYTPLFSSSGTNSSWSTTYFKSTSSQPTHFNTFQGNTVYMGLDTLFGLTQSQLYSSDGQTNVIPKNSNFDPLVYLETDSWIEPALRVGSEKAAPVAYSGYKTLDNGHNLYWFEMNSTFAGITNQPIYVDCTIMPYAKTGTTLQVLYNAGISLKKHIDSYGNPIMPTEELPEKIYFNYFNHFIKMPENWNGSGAEAATTYMFSPELLKKFTISIGSASLGDTMLLAGKNGTITGTTVSFTEEEKDDLMMRGVVRNTATNTLTDYTARFYFPSANDTIQGLAVITDASGNLVLGQQKDFFCSAGITPMGIPKVYEMGISTLPDCAIKYYIGDTVYETFPAEKKEEITCITFTWNKLSPGQVMLVDVDVSVDTDAITANGKTRAIQKSASTYVGVANSYSGTTLRTNPVTGTIGVPATFVYNYLQEAHGITYDVGAGITSYGGWPNTVEDGQTASFSYTWNSNTHAEPTIVMKMGGDATTAFTKGTVQDQENGWKKVTITTPAATGDIKVTLRAEAKTYKVTFESNGGTTVDPITGVAYNATVAEPTNVSKTGARLDGWYTTNTFDNGTKWTFATSRVTKDITLYAKWVNQYTLTYNANGGSGAPKDETHNAGTLVSVSQSKPIWANHSFAYWTPDQTGSGTKYNSGSQIALTEDMTLYAQWLKDVVVHFDTQGGTPIADIQIERSLNDRVLENYGGYNNVGIPTKEGHIFMGWVTEPDGIEKAGNIKIGPKTPVTDEITVYAKWKKDHAVTIRFETFGGTPIPETIVVPSINDLLSEPCPIQPIKTLPTLDGHTFNHWYLDSYALFESGVYDDPVLEEQVNRLLEPVKKERLRLQSLYDAGKMTAEEYQQALNELSAQGYFKVSNDVLDQVVASNAYSLALQAQVYDITVYANWTTDGETPATYYTLTYESNGGTEYPAERYASNAVVSMSKTPDRQGYGFDGWYSNKELTNKVASVKMTKNMTVYAKWSEHTHTVTFDAGTGKDDPTLTGLPQPISVLDGGKLLDYPQANQKPDRALHSFILGWWKDPACTEHYYFDTPVTEDITIYAKWADPINVIFDSEGGTPAQQTQLVKAHGGVISEPKAPSRNGYKLTGWSTNFVELYASSSKEEYRALAAQYDAAMDALQQKYQDGEIDSEAYQNQMKQLDDEYGAKFPVTFPDNQLAEITYDTGNTEITLHAQWTADDTDSTDPIPDPTYTVTYTDGVDGEEVFADQTTANLASGTATPVFNGTPTRSGYTFTGWSPAIAATVTANVTYTAQWSRNSSGGGGTIYYTLSYESNGGTKYADERYSSGITVKLDKVPSRTGYAFTGWYADKSLTEKIEELKMTSSKTVYAGWRASTVPDMLNGADHFAYVVGYTDGTVRPQNNISRAEVATIFFRLLKEEVRDQNLTSDNSFADVTKGMWCNKPISTMAALGIVKGRSDTAFNPDAPITRAEFATICARFDTTVTDGDSNFTDISGHWAQADIERAATLGWIQGYTDGTFRPENYITRAEAMTMINRVLCRIPEDEDDLLKDMIVWPDNQSGAWYYLAVQEATNGHDYASKGEVYERWTKLIAAPNRTKYEN